jgi:acyl-CoA dehydrogenase
MTSIFADALNNLLKDLCPPDKIRQIENNPADRSLWQAVSDAGFADALLPESASGAALSMPQAFELLEICGRYALPATLAETMVARALLHSWNQTHPCGSVVLAEGHIEHNQCRAQVPAGRLADWVLLKTNQQTWLLPTDQAELQPYGLAFDANMSWPMPDARQNHQPVAAADARWMPKHWQALLFACQSAGALMNVFEQCLQYANDRIQFGKPIGKFQAIQHNLSIMAEHVFAARMAARLGCDFSGLQPDVLKVAVAKARTSEAIQQVNSLAHALHGAIGFTSEFNLQLLTRRLHAWRQSAGSEAYWHELLGQSLISANCSLSLDFLSQLSNLKVLND